MSPRERVEAGRELQQDGFRMEQHLGLRKRERNDLKGIAEAGGKYKLCRLVGNGSNGQFPHSRCIYSTELLPFAHQKMKLPSSGNLGHNTNPERRHTFFFRQP